MSTQLVLAPETSTRQIHQIFELQKQHQRVIGNTTVAQRKEKLSKLHQTILKYRPQIREALYQDYRKHPSEVDLTEIYPVTGEIKHAKRNIREWMGKHHVQTPLALLGSSSYIKYEPKGTVLIISPWNFPVNLTFGPLVSAIAAGNTVMIKPSEITPHTSALMKQIITELFREDEVALVEGGVSTSTTLLSLPFNHIFFTGSPKIGKVVMAAAAKHLASVTLELGGKSPTIIDQSANIKVAARRIAWGKYLNNGQVCLTSDYVFVHKSKRDEFIKTVKHFVNQFYSANAYEEKSYGRIVNSRHFDRLKNYIKEAVDQGAQIELGGTFDKNENYIAPTVITNIPKDSNIRKHEIFGPIMPVYEFTDIDEVIQEINSREKPLALYIFSRSKKNIHQILSNTRAGGGCINHNVIHFFNNALPFGGTNNSGIGKGHGDAGFKAFSNARGMLKQHVPNVLDFLLPPYNSFKQKIIDLAIKYF